MHAFGRDVASRTVAGVLTAAILAVVAVIWTDIKWVAPRVATWLNITPREAAAWTAVGVLSVTVLVLVIVLVRQVPQSTQADAAPHPGGSLEIALNGGQKPSITLTHRGGPTTYEVDGQILRLSNGTANPHPARFRCELVVAGRQGWWEATLDGGDWAHVILGSVEDVPGNNWQVAGTVLVIRRGRMGEHVRVPDSGAIIELQFRAKPPLVAGGETIRVCVMRDPNAPNAVVVPLNVGPV